jgi:type IV secretory pathway VirB10-like protein
MSTRQDHVLELAISAWRNTRPEQDEVDDAVGRVRRRLRARRWRPRTRGPSLVVAFGLVLLGALAYAAVKGSRGGDQPQPPRAGSSALHALPAGTASLATPEREQPSAQEGPRPVESDTLDPATSDPPRTAPHARAAAIPATPEADDPPPDSESPPAAASPEQTATAWREVDTALGARDDKRAARALTQLASSDDRSTRLKARLGLAQLAASRGNCSSARTIATGIIAEPGVDPALARRAHRVASRCR